MLKVAVNKADHIQGPDNAPITLVEYGDYECPYCRIAHSVVKRIIATLGDKLKFVFRHFPLVEIHPHAGIAAMTAEFAGSKNKFWEMHDILYENQDHLELHDLLSYADALNLPRSELQAVIEQETFAEKIREDFIGGVKSGVNGTPTFFINEERYNGSYEYETLLAALMSEIE